MFITINKYIYISCKFILGNLMKYILAVDIGGTTFNSGLFSDSFNQIDVSEKDKIRFYSNKKSNVAQGIINQINLLIENNNIDKKNILGLGIAAPGPLDPVKGKILNTPNLKIFSNYRMKLVNSLSYDFIFFWLQPFSY